MNLSGTQGNSNTEWKATKMSETFSRGMMGRTLARMVADVACLRQLVTIVSRDFFGKIAEGEILPSQSIDRPSTPSGHVASKDARPFGLL